MRELAVLELPQLALNIDVLALVADSVICTDENGLILVFNRAAEESFGYSKSEVIGQPVGMLLPESYRARHADQVRGFASGTGAMNRLMGDRREVRGRRKNGEEFPAEAMVSRQTIDGRTILTVVNRDITERKELEELREVAARELDHRLTNVLSVVNSLVSLTAASATTVDEFRDSLTGRLNALAKTQSALLGKEQSASLRELILAELGQYQSADRANLAIEGPLVSVGPRVAQMLALAVHELATNSAKYGALGKGGRVAVTADLEGEGESGSLTVTWRETGGPPVKPPKREGFGTRLIMRVVPRVLKAKTVMEYRPEGLVCRMAIPQSTLAAHDSRTVRF